MIHYDSTGYCFHSDSLIVFQRRLCFQVFFEHFPQVPHLPLESLEPFLRRSTTSGSCGNFASGLSSGAPDMSCDLRSSLTHLFVQPNSKCFVKQTVTYLYQKVLTQTCLNMFLHKPCFCFNPTSLCIKAFSHKRVLAQNLLLHTHVQIHQTVLFTNKLHKNNLCASCNRLDIFISVLLVYSYLAQSLSFEETGRKNNDHGKSPFKRLNWRLHSIPCKAFGHSTGSAHFETVWWFEFLGHKLLGRGWTFEGIATYFMTKGALWEWQLWDQGFQSWFPSERLLEMSGRLEDLGYMEADFLSRQVLSGKPAQLTPAPFGTKIQELPSEFSSHVETNMKKTSAAFLPHDASCRTWEIGRIEFFNQCRD